MALASISLSVLAFGLSKLLGSGDFSNAVYSELGVASLGDVFKSGSEKGLARIFKETPNYDKDQLNHDLNQAARKSLLLATWYACRGCLLEYADDDSKKAEKEWIAKLADSLKTKIEKSADEIPQSYLKEEDILTIFNSDDNPAAIENKLITKLQEEAYEVIRTDTHSLLLLSPEGFNLLKKNIENGWTEQPTPTSPEKKYNWFSLICGIFNDECKTPVIEAALQNKLLKNILKSIEENGKSFDELCRNLSEIKQTAYRTEGKTEFLINYVNDFRTEVFYQLQEIIERLRNRENKSIPTEIVRNLTNLDANVFGRKTEAETVRKAFQGKNGFADKRFYLVVAPSGFGKSFVLIKALKEVTDKRIIKPDYAGDVQRLIRIDCRNIKTISEIVSEFSNIIGLDIGYPNDLGFPFAYLNGVLFHFVREVGKVWLILDNFEAWLDGENNYQPINRDIYAFLQALFKGNHTIRGVFLSQSALHFEADEYFEVLDDVSRNIRKGLPDEDALKMMRTNGKKVGLDKEPDERLKEFLIKTDNIPQAITSLIGYLSTIKNTPNGTLQSVLADFAKFDEHEQKDGETHTRYLISKQIKAQSPQVKLLLQAISFFDQRVPYEALRLLASDEDISRLVDHNLAALERDVRGAIYYDLHPYFRRETLKTLPKFEDIYINLQAYAISFGNKANELQIHGYLQLAADLYELAKKIFQCLFDKYQKEVVGLPLQTITLAGMENNLASAYMNKGVSLDDLGKLEEAIGEYNKAIKIRERLVNELKQDQFANDLASDYMNKGVSLRIMGKLEEATDEYNKAIAINERLMFLEKRTEVISDLAKNYYGKGIVLDDLGKSNEAITEHSKAIAILKELVETGLNELTNDLAKAYMNKGVSLGHLGKLSEATEIYGDAIKLWEDSLQNGNIQYLPDLIKALRNCTKVSIKLEDWQKVGVDIEKAFAFSLPLLQSEDFSEHFKQLIGKEIGAIIYNLKEVAPANREKVYANLGEFTELVKDLVEQD